MTTASHELVTGAASSAALTRIPGPLQSLDAALLSLRRASAGQLARAWLAGLPLAAVVLLLYYLERVEGLRTPRAVFAGALVIAFWFRFQTLAQVARELVQWQRPGLPLTAATPTAVQLASSASIAALGLWLWAWPLLWLGRMSALALLAALPLLAARGAVAPAFLARSACSEERGLAAFTRAVEDTRGARAVMLGVELAVTLGVLVSFGNLYALGALALLLASSVLGLDVAFLSAFLTPDNEFVLLLLLGTTLLLFEPLRAAVSALAFSEARSRNDGADLHAAIDDLARTRAVPGRPLSRTGTVLLCLLGCTAASASAFAQAAPGSEQDVAVRARAQHILERPEFHEFNGAEIDPYRLRELFERWLGREEERESLPASQPRFELPVAPWLIVLIAIVLLSAVVLYVTTEARKQGLQPRAAAVSSLDAVRSQTAAPPEPLTEAARLAARGQYREALRLLYATELALLDRTRAIRFEVGRTNGHYVRVLPEGPLRQQLARLTQLFEHSWYGTQPATQADYAWAEQCVAQLQRGSERPE
jgi:hypothetical protein